MRFRLIILFFGIIGIAIGIILSLQIRAGPVKTGSSPLEQIEVQKSLLTTFAVEQNELQKKFDEAESKLQEAQALIESRSSKQTTRLLEELKRLAGFSEIKGKGIKIIINDNPSVFRADFSAVNEYYVQAPDIRDLVNALFLKDAIAISVNGKRIAPLTPIQSVFDSILIGNFQTAPPFIVEAVGEEVALREAAKVLQGRKIHISVQVPEKIVIGPLESGRKFNYMTLLQ